MTNSGIEYTASYMRWGLIPSWSKANSVGNRLFNARSETVASKITFRTSFQRRRCLILADGFYEWIKTDNGKVPMRIVLDTREPFGFAGIWDSWNSPGDGTIYSCAILTTEPNAVMRPIHNRMPVILPRNSEGIWLTEGSTLADLAKLLLPFPPEHMDAYPVSTLVNSALNDIPDVLAHASANPHEFDQSDLSL